MDLVVKYAKTSLAGEIHNNVLLTICEKKTTLKTKKVYSLAWIFDRMNK